MPSLQQDKQALDWLADNPTDQYAPAVAQKLGVQPRDVEAWKWTKDNPADMRAVQVRNKVFDVVADSRPDAVDEQGGEIKGGIPTDRLAVKNLLDGDPEAQKTYFEKKGYRTRQSIKGDLQVKAPGDSYYKPIDPEGLDKWDAADVLFDVGSGIITGANAAKVGGGPAGAAWGALIGGVTGAGTELGKQAIAKAAGMRDDYNAGEIAKQGLIGAAVPVGLDLLGAGLKATGKGIGKAVGWATGSGLKENADEIVKATEAIGGKATPGQLFEGEVVQKLENTQRQSAGMLGGTKLRKQIDQNIKAAANSAEDIVAEATGKTANEVGADVATKLKAAVLQRLQPAEQIYGKYEAELADHVVEPAAIADSFQKVIANHELNPEVHAAVSRFGSVMEKVKTIDDLKVLTSNVGAAARVADANRNWPLAQGLRELQSELKDLKGQSIVNAFEAVSPGKGEIVKAELANADKIYASTIADIGNVLGKKITKGSPKRELEAFFEKTASPDVVDKILKTGNPAQLEKFQKAFPEIFEAARTSKLAEMAKAAEINGLINPKKLVKSIEALEPESKALLFGHDAGNKASSLKAYLDSLPTKNVVGPSGTPEGLRWHDVMNLANPLFYARQVMSLGKTAYLHLLTAPQLGTDIFTTTGKAAQSAIGKGGTVAAAKVGLINPLLPKPMREDQ